MHGPGVCLPCTVSGLVCAWAGGVLTMHCECVYGPGVCLPCTVSVCMGRGCAYHAL